MVRYKFLCECGKSFLVTASQAGVELSCVCGRTSFVPRLSVLQRSKYEEVNDEHPMRAGLLKPGFVVITALLYFCWYQELSPKLIFFLFGLGMFLVGKIWLLQSMFREVGTPALLTFVTPIFDWFFIFKRPDVAWKPILLQVMGIVVCLFAIVLF